MTPTPDPLDPARIAEVLRELADRVHRFHPEDRRRLLVMLDKYLDEVAARNRPRISRRR